MAGVGGSGFSDLGTQQTGFAYNQQQQNVAANEGTQQYSDASSIQQQILSAVNTESSAAESIGQKSSGEHQALAKAWAGQISQAV